MFLENEPLIVSWKNIKNLTTNKGGGAFFGVGLMSKTNISVGLPFDILSFFFVSELLKKSQLVSKVVVLIADRLEISLTRIIRNFALKNFEILKASDIHKLPSFQNILKDLPNLENRYLKLKIADTLWLKKHRDINLKIGQILLWGD